MGEWGVRLDIGMMFSVGSEGSGGLQNFLQTQILEDSLGNEEVQLGVEASTEMELHQHVSTTLSVSALEKMLTRLGILLQMPQTVSEVLEMVAGLLSDWCSHYPLPDVDEGGPRESLCLYWTISNQSTDTSACQCYHRESTDTA